MLRTRTEAGQDKAAVERIDDAVAVQIGGVAARVEDRGWTRAGRSQEQRLVTAEGLLCDVTPISDLTDRGYDPMCDVTLISDLTDRGHDHLFPRRSPARGVGSTRAES